MEHKQAAVLLDQNGTWASHTQLTDVTAECLCCRAVNSRPAAAFFGSEMQFGGTVWNVAQLQVVIWLWSETGAALKDNCETVKNLVLLLVTILRPFFCSSVHVVAPQRRLNKDLFQLWEVWFGYCWMCNLAGWWPIQGARLVSSPDSINCCLTKCVYFFSPATEKNDNIVERKQMRTSYNAKTESVVSSRAIEAKENLWAQDSVCDWLPLPTNSINGTQT